ncbi:MAG TPA: peptidoglycan-binding protein [Ignavibacteria bacterium]|nr:peptidoglycan-binding protein [Ignavibacteria bacterium]
MSYQSTIKKLIGDKIVGSVLKRKSKVKNAVRALQNILHELGFDEELKWKKYGADGDYGSGTSKAVKDFAERNKISGNGENVTLAIAKKLLSRYEILDDLQHLYNAVKGNKIEKLLYRNSPHSVGVSALQSLLNELGFGKELKWEKYGADGVYGNGTTKAVKALAKKEGIPGDGRKINKTLAERIINKLEVFYGKDWAKDSSPNEINLGLSIRQSVENGRTRIYVSDGTLEGRFTSFKKGVYTFGGQKVTKFINANKSSLESIGLTNSAMNVMIAVSENEGNLDAVNTWDNSFMTFGMFQWTAGAGKDKGELPALLKKIKTANIDLFFEHYGQYGLDLINTNNVSGNFTLNGKKLSTPEDKEILRSYEWVFYFWKSGRDTLIKSIQIQHALSRLNRFYRTDKVKVNGHFISDLVTSEYGVGLLLDNHVNRPAYVKPCIEQAMNQTNLTSPQNWGTAEEQKLINAYLKIRETYGRYPMTDANKRAAVTKKYLDKGIISDKRGSFKYNV